MGLTRTSAYDTAQTPDERKEGDIVVALAGNPNVGKSTVFNELTGMNQHTGNWPGKTVSSACGYCERDGKTFLFVDIPGTYSLLPHSPEEVVARDFLCFGGADCVVAVCDATCLERNLNLVLQICEITPKVIVCINLMDEARKKGISVNLEALRDELGVTVCATEARSGKGLSKILDEIPHAASSDSARLMKYSSQTEALLGTLTKEIAALCPCPFPRFAALRLLCRDDSFLSEFERKYNVSLIENDAISEILKAADSNEISNEISESLVLEAEKIYKKTVSGGCSYTARERRLDRIVTSRAAGFPIMILGLLVIFWLTIEGANYPSAYLSSLLSGFEAPLYSFLLSIRVPDVVATALTCGVWRVLAWVVSVMLPPMAIFFPLFTLLEDSGYLPRIAFNLDRAFKKCNACGKQSLTMCMGFGCNAAGVVGCRIIDSPRERLIAMLTNTLVPCNGRFPSLIAIITIFFVGSSSGILQSSMAAVFLVLLILLGIAMTFLSSRLLSATVLRGVPSNFTLELPPYRRPQIIKVLIRSVFDRTLFVLGRAVAVAAPAGLIIWLMANISINGQTLLFILSNFLNPFGELLGLDGVILTAFILGFPANEIVLPLIIMIYTSGSALTELSDISTVSSLLIQNGWTIKTAISFMLFSIMHWPCSTTLLTIKKESRSIRWTLLAFLLPTLLGIVFCMLSNLLAACF